MKGFDFCPNLSLLISLPHWPRLFVATLAWLTFASQSRADFLNGQDAAQVIGQMGFDSDSFPAVNAGPNPPISIAVDATTGKLFVSDRGRNRVLRYPNVDSLANGEEPEAALGQPSLTGQDRLA